MGQKADRPYVLVQIPDVAETTSLNILIELIDPRLVDIPEHDADGDTRIPNTRGHGANPEEDAIDAIAIRDCRKPRVITKSPSETQLSTSVGGSGGSGNAIRRLGGRRRWAVVRRGGTLGSARRLGSGSARGGGGRPGLALRAALAALLPGDSVVVWNLPRQVVPLHRKGESLGGSERAEDDSERRQRKYVEKFRGRHLFKTSSKRECGDKE